MIGGSGFVGTNLCFAYRNSIGSLHNANLTLLYDFGLLGLILIITLNLKIVTNLKYLTNEWRSLSLKYLIYLSITSATETIYSFNYIFILVTFVFISQIRKHRLPTNILTRDF